MTKWYVKRYDKQVGPFEADQLKQLAADGKIRPDDQVRRDDQVTWHKAESVKGLLVVSVQKTVSSGTTPTPLSTSNQSPPPLPSANANKKLPWYHPASLVAYAIVITVIFMFSQLRLASRRTKAPQATKEAQQEKTADVTKSKPPNLKSESGSKKANPKSEDSELKFIKINTDRNAPVLTREFLPETSENRTYSFVSRGEKEIYSKTTLTGVPSYFDNTVYGENSLMSILPGGFFTRLYLGAAPGDKWYFGDFVEYEFEGFVDKEGNVFLDQSKDYAKITERSSSEPRMESDFLFQRGVGIIAVNQFRLEEGKRPTYPILSSRMISR